MALSLYVNYNGGPSGMAMLMSIPPSTLLFYSRLILFLIPFMPLGAWIILRLFRFRVRIINLVFAVVSAVLSVPVACLILEWTRHKGGSDPLHALKSGLLAVLWVYSLGLVVIGIKKGLHKRPDPKILLTWIRMVYRKKLH
jgi:flagellar biosynthesis protein FliQ